MQATVEETLTEIVERAAFARGFAQFAAESQERPDVTALNGLSAICGDVERLAQALKATLPIDTLARGVRS